MSRADHELANNVLRDALSMACDLIADLAAKEPERVADHLETWRMLVERTRAEDNEDDPPFSEHAREAAWRAWMAAHREYAPGFAGNKDDLAKFREWWFQSAQRRARGELDYDVERLTPKQQEDLLRPPRRYAEDDDYEVEEEDW